MPWWKRISIPDNMDRPDTRTEKVIERLEVVAERMEKVALILTSDMDKADDEQRTLRHTIREAQGGKPPRRGGVESRGVDAES